MLLVEDFARYHEVKYVKLSQYGLSLSLNSYIEGVYSVPRL